MSEFGLFRYRDGNNNDYYLNLSNASVHAQTRISSEYFSVLDLISLSVKSKHWRSQIGCHALMSMCAGITSLEQTRHTVLALIEDGFTLDVICDTFGNNTTVYRTSETAHLGRDDFYQPETLKLIKNGNNITEETRSRRLVLASEGVDIFAVVDLGNIDMTSWELPTLNNDHLA